MTALLETGSVAMQEPYVMVVGTRTVSVDPDDPYQDGFVLSDVWGRESPEPGAAG